MIHNNIPIKKSTRVNNTVEKYIPRTLQIHINKKLLESNKNIRTNY